MSVTAITIPTGPKGDQGDVGPAGSDGAQGPAGSDGATGPAGSDGADGQGVPVGGTTGQVLKKIDGTDYNTEWADESGGGGGGNATVDVYPLFTTETTFLDNTLTNVGDWTSIVLPANAVGHFAFFALLDSPTNADGKFDINVTSGSFTRFHIMDSMASGGGQTIEISNGFDFTQDGGGGFIFAANWLGGFVVGGSGATFSVRWAQNTSQPSDSELLAGSVLKFTYRTS